MRKTAITQYCILCQKPYEIRISHAHLRQTCSRACAAEIKSRTKSGPNHPRWKSGKEISPCGYQLEYNPNHPDAHKGKVFTHRLMMEQKIGRKLTSKEIVHHKDGNKLNNKIENLQIMTRAEHINHHRKELQNARRSLS